MGKNRFLYDKVVRDSTITPIVSTDYHPSYPVENVRNIWTDYYYRSKYGANSGWGYWYIDSSSNKLYFDDNGGTPRTATITVGAYDADTLAAEIETQMEAQTTDGFTVAYSDTSNKFSITNTVGTYELTCTTTTNAIWTYIGFNTDADKTGASAYNSDNVRIHSGVSVEFENSAAITSWGMAVMGLNLSSTYQIFRAERWTGSAWEIIDDIEHDATNQRGILFFATQKSGTKYRVAIRDWENAQRFSQVGTIVWGDYKEISTWYEYGYSEDIEDTSQHQYSKDGYINVISGYFLESMGVSYNVMSTDEDKLVDLYRTIGKRYPFVFVQDSDDPENTMQYAMMTGKLSRRGEDAYTKNISLAWVGVS